jgi:hypothetical protein
VIDDYWRVLREHPAYKAISEVAEVVRVSDVLEANANYYDNGIAI